MIGVAETLHKAKGLYKRIDEGRTEAFVTVWRDVCEGWTVETSARLDDFIVQTRKRLVELGGTVEEHDRKVNDIVDQQETQVLAAIYQNGAHREAIAERRKMLSFAAAAIVDPTLTIEEKASAERVLRSLDPCDVLELHKLARAVGKIERLPNGRANGYTSTDELRHALLSASTSYDALVSTGCVREKIVPEGGGWGGAASGAYDVAHVTDRGRLVLHVLAKYLDEKHDAFTGMGREEIPGSRSEIEAQKLIAGTPGFKASLRAALAASAKLDGHDERRPRFEPSLPTLAPDAPHQQRRNGVREAILTEADPSGLAQLVIGAAPPESAHAVPKPSPEFLVTLEDLPQYGRPAMNIRIKGPFDVLRWLADDLDAHWS
ncbi:MAG: hypothetical protein J0I07_10150 [Myxococcales bacterium]|nr:hypothetical protein [Myxococcales bacterium]